MSHSTCKRFTCSGLVFEKAYCEYRLNRTCDALKTLKSVPEMDGRMKELYAQVVGSCFIKYLCILRLEGVMQSEKIGTWVDASLVDAPVASAKL